MQNGCRLFINSDFGDWSTLINTQGVPISQFLSELTFDRAYNLLVGKDDVYEFLGKSVAGFSGGCDLLSFFSTLGIDNNICQIF